MYSMTLEINQICNLRCRYCYLGEKGNQIMELETAQKCVDLAFHHAKAHKDRTLWFDFIGGEALMTFALLKDIVDYIERKNQGNKMKLLLSMTTNGTVWTQEMIDWLIYHDFSLKLSLDGTKEVTDKNRVFIGHGSVHDAIIGNLSYIQQYEKKTGKNIQITNVITKDNFSSYFESFQYIVEELGFHMIDTALDETVQWERKELELIEEQIDKCFSLYAELLQAGRMVRWGFLDNVFQLPNKPHRFFSCGAGIISSYVRTDGSIYACSCHLEKDSMNHIGSIEDGYVEERIQYLKKLDHIENEKCEQCPVADYCRVKSCIFQNLKINGNIHQPIYSLCYMQRFQYRFYKEKRDILNKLISIPTY